jgi:mannan endo-1,4-beta-mannosidase
VNRRNVLAAVAAISCLPAMAWASGNFDRTLDFPQPANRQSSKTTRALLAFLASLRSGAKGRTLIGQFCGYPNIQPSMLVDSHPWSTFRPEYMTDVTRMTGKTPALMGLDYYGNSGAIEVESGISTTEHSDHRTLNYNDASGVGVHINKAAIDWWRSGGLVTINAHMYRPDTHKPDNSGSLLKFGFGGTDPRYPADGRFKPYDLRRLLPGGEDRKSWLAMMNGMADGLSELKDADVVVIWRPFHEMDRGFWWGRHDPGLFQEVWRDMFRHLSEVRHLDNLIWAFTGSLPYYPGDDFTDIVGDDQYQPEADVVPILADAEARDRLHAMTEFGFGIDKLRDNSVASYDFEILAKSMARNLPRSIYLLVWSDAWRIGNPRHRNQQRLMRNPHFMTREDLRRLWKPTADQ